MRSKWKWCVIVFISTTSVLFSSLTAIGATEKIGKPNILLIVADDLGYSDLGSFGGEISTPRLDDLAKLGLRFSNFHAGPTCSPSRAMILTGTDNHCSGIGNMRELMAENQKGKPGYEGYLNHRVVSVATLLKDAGYHTYMTGKWHLGYEDDQLPSARGFERTYTLVGGGFNHFLEKGYHPHRDAATYRSNGKEVHIPKDFYSSNFYTDKLLEFIDLDRSDGKPFFAYLPYTAPHWPLQAPQDYIKKYEGKYDMGWDKLREQRFMRMKKLGLIPKSLQLPPRFQGLPRLQGVPAWDSLTPEQKKFESKKMAVYAAMVDNMDHNIGRLFDHLKRIGQYDNTLIVFVSDNGAAISDHNSTIPLFKEKMIKLKIDNSYENIGNATSFIAYGPPWSNVSNTPLKYFKTILSEGGIRVPFIISYPGITESGIKRAFATVKDLTPTFLEVAGVEHPGTRYKNQEVFSVTGKSMLPFLKGTVSRIHDDNESIGFELLGHSALITGDWKVLKLWPPFGDKKWRLYNISEDPSELNDLSGKCQDRLKDLVERYEQYAIDNGVVTVPDDYDPAKAAVRNMMGPGWKASLMTILISLKDWWSDVVN